MTRTLLTTTALFLLAQPLAAADCQSWQVGFEFTSCTVEGTLEAPIQVYAMPDGSVRRLTEDPKVTGDQPASNGMVGQYLDAVRETLAGEPMEQPDAAAASGEAAAADVSAPAQGENLTPQLVDVDHSGEPGQDLAAEAAPAPTEAPDAATTGTSRVTVKTAVIGDAPAEPAEADAQSSGRIRSGVQPAIPALVTPPADESGEPVPPEEAQQAQAAPAPQPAPAAAPLPVDVTSLDLPKDLPAKVMTTPGQTVMLQMSVGHLNRIETPFSQPVIKTSQGEDVLVTDFDENFVYVTVTQPSTIFVHEQGHADPAIAISLIPMKIMPRQVKVELPPEEMRRVERQRPPEAPTAQDLAAATSPAVADPGASSRVSSKSPKRKPDPNSRGVRFASGDGPVNEHNPSYYSAQLLKTFSSGRVPSGFYEGSISGFSASQFCTAPAGSTFTFADGRMIYSNDMVIVRGHVTASSRVQLDERTCNKHPGTVAVAFSPKTLISPDNPTDFYIILNRVEVDRRG